MRRNTTILCLLFCSFVICFTCIFLRINHVNTIDKLKDALSESTADNLHLTIYFMDPTILTRMPVRTVEDLLSYPGAKTICVNASELSGHSELLNELASTRLQSVEKESNPVPITDYLRLVYVLENENGEILMEVRASDLANGESILVNDCEVENSPIFFNFIAPFLSSEDKEMLIGPNA